MLRKTRTHGLKITLKIIFWGILLCLLNRPVLSAPPPGAPTDKHPEAYQGLSQQDLAKLNKGEIVILKDIGHEESTSKGFIKAAMIVNQPIDKVYSLMAQDWRQAEYVPYLEKMFVVQKFPDGNLDEEELKILIVTLHFRVRWYHEPQKFAFHWNLDPDFKNDLKRLEGFWKFYYLDDNRTLCRYGTVSETGFGIPKSVQDFLTRKDLPKALEAQKLWLESGGNYRKPGYKSGN